MSNTATIGQMDEAIAKFMGDHRQKQGEFGMLLKYHSSWDWLMPVIIKIKSIVADQQEKSFLQRWKPIENELFNLYLKGVHYAVYQFITWYNLQQTKQPQ